MDRRQFLKLGGVASATSLLSGCSSLFDGSEKTPREDTPATRSPSSATTRDDADDLLAAPTTRRGIEFDTVLDAVDDLGMDPNGEKPIDDALASAIDDGTLVVFPPGRYLATEEHSYETPIQRFGMLGLGTSRRDVQFVFPKGNEGAPDPADYIFLRIDHQGARDVLVENLTIQQTPDEVTGVGTKFVIADGLRLIDLEFAGFSPNTSRHSPSYSVIAHITDRDGVGVIRRFVSVGGGVVSEYPNRKTPIGAFHDHRGELRIEDAHVEESGSHSAYVSRTQGCVRVLGGLFRNNDNTNLRMSGGGHPNKRSWVKGARIEIDLEAAQHLREGEYYENPRGLRVESGGENDYGHHGLLVEDVDVVIRSNLDAGGLPLLQLEHTHGSTTVRNSRFVSSVEDVTPIAAYSPIREMIDGPTGLTLDSVVVQTDAKRVLDGGAIVITGRPNSTIEDSSVRLVDGWVDGIRTANTDGLSIDNTTIESRQRTNIPRIAGTSSSAFGWNDGVVIRDATNCNLRRTVIDVPGTPTQFVNSQVETKQISIRN
jgi:hypothetical protein